MTKLKKRFRQLRISMEKYDFSMLSIFFIVVFVVIYSLSLSNWKDQTKIIASDVIHYYAYLPASIIYKDLSMAFVYENPTKYGPIFWPVPAPNGKHAIMVTMGMSILYAPAFFVTHAIVLLTGGDASGFSEAYRLGLMIGGWFYLLMALFMLRNVLLRYFSRYATALALLMAVIGTNLFHYETHETTMSHAYSFFLFAAFLLMTVKWHEKSNLKNAFLLGVVSGLIALVRPSNIVLGLLFIFWNTYSWKTLRAKIMFFVAEYKSILVILFAAILVWIPQFLYWKFYTGTWFFMGYGNDQGFFFSNPQIFNNLLSYRKGWLVYTPIILLAFAGLILLWKKRPGIVFPVIIYSIINIYIVSSWWSWWYGGGFGMRAYVETYAIYSLGFAAFAEWVFSKGKWFIKLPALALILLLIGFSYFQTRQYRWNAIHYVGMTKEAYWHQFLILKPYGDYYKKLTIPDMDKARKGIYVFEPAE